MNYLRLLIALALFSACHPTLKIAGKKATNPLEKALAAHATDFDSILSRPDVYEVQIIYTQINRDVNNQPHFKTWHWNADSSRYFYPASMVKMPLALLALEKINNLQKQFPRLNRETPYMLDSLRPFQQRYVKDPGAPNGKPSIAHDVRQIFAVSDNLAYNHLFEFLGRDYINQTLREKGYLNTGIVHRFNYPGRDNRYSSPITFYESSTGIYQQGERFEEKVWQNPQQHTQKGKGFYNSADSLILLPFDMSKKNWFALSDMDRMLKAVLFPEAIPAQQRFNLSTDDYQFLRHYMGIFPRECDYPKYDTTEYYDGYVKFFLFGDGKEPRDGTVRVYNKVGFAYGTATDVAYITDEKNNVEFMLSATILCNSDGIFNDDRYDYDMVGFPFLAKLGRAMLEYEIKRKK
ncbi:MAG: serine hydrolase [Saprospiraceae bacterium]|nr:serine hydrolase [Saprospiraceae bacterium]